MTAVLMTLLEITVYSVALFAAIWLFRLTLKKQLSPAMLYTAWFLLIARLLMPVTVASGFALFVIPAANEAPAAMTSTGQAEDADIAELLAGLDNTVGTGTAALPEKNMAQPALNEAQPPEQAAETEPWAEQLQITWDKAAFAVWLAGIAVMLTQAAFSYARLRKRLQIAAPAAPEWQHAADGISVQLGLRRMPRVVILAGFPSPALTVGIRPMIVLPAELLEGDEDTIRYALLHELTHIRRRDHLITLLLHLLRAVYWFNPVVWLTARQMRLDMETACDNRLAGRLSAADRKRYAGTILEMYAREQVRYALGMALGQTKKTAEKRLRGVYMRGRSSLRGRTTAVLLAALLLIACFTTACQPTPAEPVVVNQNKDLVQEVQENSKETEEKAAPQNYLEKLEMPEHYTYSSVNEAASLTINVDADVIKPDAAQMPLARMKPVNFTQEQVTGMFNYLFPDEKPYVPRSQMTKAEIEEQILYYQRMINGGEIDGDPIRQDTIDEFNAQIKGLEKQYETAPDKVPEPVICDGTMQYEEHDIYNVHREEENIVRDYGGISKNYKLEATLGETFLHINVSANEDAPGSSLWYVKRPVAFSTDKMTRIKPGDALPEAAQDKLTLPLEDATALADGFFEAAGLDDVKLFASYVVDNHGTGHVDDNWDPASEYAYQMFYTHTVNGVPVSCHESHSGGGGEPYTEPWFYESISVLVANDGIIEIRWAEPGEVTEVVEPDVELIGFETAMDKFESAVGYTYGQYLDWGDNVETTVEVTIDNIQLNVIRLREKDKPDEKAGLYVPAYVFYGYVKQTQAYKDDDYTYEGYMTSSGSGNDFYPGPFMVIAINAIDGSIINTMSDVT